MRVYSLLAVAAAIATLVLAGGEDSSSLPTITLDYSTIQAVGGNTTVGYYKFQNIRYAKAPTGDLRFAAPQWPDVETDINTGNLADTDVDCASSEDCLFLDVWAPVDAVGRNLPVLVYNYGGRFKLGSKSVNTPEGLFELSTDFIYVAYNYRLGLTGVATGPTYQHEGGVSNLAVWDATHAFEWVQKYIGKFGGNPNDVTAVGFSAGGSQIGFQMTRFGGNAPQLFQKAYIMSPGYLPSAGHHQAEQFWQNVSTAVGCEGGHLDCMRKVPFGTLANATTKIVNAYSYTLQPRVDGFILSNTYEASVYQGHFNFSGPCVLTHEQHEYNTVAYTGVESEEDIVTTLRVLFPAITDDVIEELLELYPAADYASAGLRFNDMQQSAQVTSKNLGLTYALGNQTWNGEVGISPAKHGTDQSYYFYSTYTLSIPTNDSTATLTSEASALTALASSITSPVDTTIARQMQKYLLSFVITGNPNSVWLDDKPYWPQYNESSDGAELVFNDSITVVADDLANEKGLYWNKALWY
ncbi:Para-nitrobenzyl esterase [Phytophthora cinnamomi]|uniref:Para-nitrobenzyl esterase n=1 Tax=Phytophthora cinnamomi TaxID=4785 RepID=UPI00355A6A82|nr:Para-nitrobenzyl esterase [Phytophthora cinnamomi]